VKAFNLHPCNPTVREPQKKLLSKTRLEKIMVDKLQQKTPKILRIIATIDDQQDERLKEAKEGDLGVLRWDRMQEYLGPTIRDSLTLP
jgi:hypothetical protein